MARNGSGTYSLPAGNPVVTGTTISSTWANTTLSDIATALTQSLAKDGQTTPTANLPLGGFKLTGLGVGTAATDSLTLAQAQAQGMNWCGTAGGTANALTLSPSPAISAYVAGQVFKFKSGASANSGATTIAISGLATIAVQVNGAACIGGEIEANQWYEIVVDASTTSCQLKKIGALTNARNAINTARATVASAATTADIWAAAGNEIDWTGTTTCTGFPAAPQAGASRILICAAAAPFTAGANMLIDGTASGNTITLAANDIVIVHAITTTQFRLEIKKYDGTAVTSGYMPPVRQTVLSGPVDANGYSAFGGSTGSATVTATGTLKATAAAGGDTNYTGSITNPSWTGLSTNGTMYLYLDITSSGVVTTGSTTLAPVYQWGGTYSVTSGQNTFNIQEMKMEAGNGATASQVYRVFIGEVTVAGGVVTAITWYSLMGRYRSATTATLPGLATATSLSHNLGINVDAILGPLLAFAKCTTAESGWQIGDVMTLSAQGATGATAMPPLGLTGRNSAILQSGQGGTTAWVGQIRTTGAFFSLTAANWSYYVDVSRGW